MRGLKLFSRCRSCKSIWVCWNWGHSEEKHYATSEFQRHEPEEWVHECWNCADCWSTCFKVTRGVPYWLLKHISHFFTDDKLFEKNHKRDMDRIQELYGEKEDLTNS